MLKLKNVSKFYYQKGIITSGFSKVNLEFKMGEFVAITGESGSGKSTLLNVISGLDSYEEGELYINGCETSHYNEFDFENYRKKYIANIFQNFNLINSYTVYQNVELILLLNGYKKKDIHDKIMNLIDKVGLSKYKNTKVSKLSGGQKQRVAIARALAKETPIIVADEPTGNLDKKSADSVLKLLSEISKDKLVIVVTHNYDQVLPYVTRKIKMHDGKVVEDIEIKKVNSKDEAKLYECKNITFLSKLILGIRNTYNVVPKFLLLFLVYFFLTLTLVGEYTGYKATKYESSLQGYNSFFNDTSTKRIVLKKKDKTSFTDADFEKIRNVGNVKNIIENDLLVDSTVYIQGDNFYLNGVVRDINTFEGKLTKGRMPENENEIVVLTAFDNHDNILNKTVDNIYLFNNDYLIQTGKLTIVGIKQVEGYFNGYEAYFYMNNSIINEISKYTKIQYNTTYTIINEHYLKSGIYAYNNMLYPSSKVSQGCMIIPEELSYYCKNANCKNTTATVNTENIYYEDTTNYNITNTYDKKTFNNYVDNLDYDNHNGIIIINDNDYYNIFNHGNYQSSVFIENEKEVKDTLNKLEDMGYKTLYLKDTLANPSEDFEIIANVFIAIIIIILVLFVFFITYFIVKLILKSRNVYFSTVRILGATKKTIKELIDIELFNVATLSYLVVIIFIMFSKFNIIKINEVKELAIYLKLSDYIILYISLIIISKLLSVRFSKSMFTKSAMKTIKEEV